MRVAREAQILVGGVLIVGYECCCKYRVVIFEDLFQENEMNRYQSARTFKKFAAITTFIVASASVSAQEVIKIGIPTGLSGANSVVAPSVVQSAELAVEEINAAGGILGKKVVLIDEQDYPTDRED